MKKIYKVQVYSDYKAFEKDLNAMSEKDWILDSWQDSGTEDGWTILAVYSSAGPRPGAAA